MRRTFFATAATLLTLGYLLPWSIAYCRDHPNQTAIVIVNVFLGWTLIGWFGALIWAAMQSPAVPLETDDAQRQPCPYCAEPILPAARVCRFCGRNLEPGIVAAAMQSAYQAAKGRTDDIQLRTTVVHAGEPGIRRTQNRFSPRPDPAWLTRFRALDPGKRFAIVWIIGAPSVLVVAFIVLGWLLSTTPGQSDRAAQSSTSRDGGEKSTVISGASSPTVAPPQSPGRTPGSTIVEVISGDANLPTAAPRPSRAKPAAKASATRDPTEDIVARTARENPSTVIRGAPSPTAPHPDAVAANPYSSNREPETEAYRQGAADRRAWETWFNQLTRDFRAGAEYWSGQRSLPKPGSCYGPAGQNLGDWTAGCIAAKRFLDPTDIHRRSEPDYRAGWNSYSPNAEPPPAPEPKKEPVLVPERRQEPLQPPPVAQPAPAPGIAGLLDKIARVEVNDKTAAARKNIFNQRPLDDQLIHDLVKIDWRSRIADLWQELCEPDIQRAASHR